MSLPSKGSDRVSTLGHVTWVRSERVMSLNVPLLTDTETANTETGPDRRADVSLHRVVWRRPIMPDYSLFCSIQNEKPGPPTRKKGLLPSAWPQAGTSAFSCLRIGILTGNRHQSSWSSGLPTPPRTTPSAILGLQLADPSWSFSASMSAWAQFYNMYVIQGLSGIRLDTLQTALTYMCMLYIIYYVYIQYIAQ